MAVVVAVGSLTACSRPHCDAGSSGLSPTHDRAWPAMTAEPVPLSGASAYQQSSVFKMVAMITWIISQFVLADGQGEEPG